MNNIPSRHLSIYCLSISIWHFLSISPQALEDINPIYDPCFIMLSTMTPTRYSFRPAPALFHARLSGLILCSSSVTAGFQADLSDRIAFRRTFPPLREGWESYTRRQDSHLLSDSHIHVIQSIYAIFLTFSNHISYLSGPHPYTFMSSLAFFLFLPFLS